MRTTRRSALALGLGALGALAFAGCAEAVDDGSFQGYVEGEYVYVGAPLAGDLVELAVARGDRVDQDELLFGLDPNPQALQLTEIEQRREQARARLADIRKGRRPSELAAIEARLASAKSGLERASRDYERRQELLDAGHTDAVSAEELDRYRTDRDVRRSEVATLEADLETARLGGRDDAVAAAQKEVDALDAALQELHWQIGEKRATAPADGYVQDTLYRTGEFVPAGRPVVSLLPPGNVKVRFFVPQALLPTIALGDWVQVHADGLGQRIRAKVAYISSEAEFTPPVIYSKESRSKLVFLVEAKPVADSVHQLRPGQPVEVHLDP